MDGNCSNLKSITSSLVLVANDGEAHSGMLSDLHIGDTFVSTFIDPDTELTYAYAARKGWHTRQDEVVVTDVTAFAWHTEVEVNNDAIEFEYLYAHKDAHCFVFCDPISAYAAAGAASEGITVDAFHMLVEAEFNNG